MRQSPRQTTDFILKPEKQKGVAYREESCLPIFITTCLKSTSRLGGAADMNRPNYCPVNSSTQVAGQFPSQAYLFVYIISNFNISTNTCFHTSKITFFINKPTC